MKCVILAAGRGTRLRPHTDTIPKAMVGFLGVPLITYQVKVLQQAGIHEIGIVSGYRSSEFDVFELPKFYNKNFASTNMVESFFSSKTFWEKDQSDLIISYGDIIYEQRNLEKLLSKTGDMTVMVDDRWLDLWSLRQSDPLNDAETLKFDEDGFISEIGKKPKSLSQIQSQYTGLMKLDGRLKKDMLRFYDTLDRNKLYDGQEFHKMYMTTFIQMLINHGWAINAARINNGWLEFDTTEDLVLYENMYREGTLHKLWCDRN